MKPSGTGVTSYILALTSSELGNRKALEFPTLKILAVIALMQLCWFYAPDLQAEAFEFIGRGMNASEE